MLSIPILTGRGKFGIPGVCVAGRQGVWHLLNREFRASDEEVI